MLLLKSTFLALVSLVLIAAVLPRKATRQSVTGFTSPLYKDVSLTNLPVAVVSGPGMDIEAADLDGDGDLDIVIANEYQPNKILLNNGKGVFTDGTPGRLPQKFLDSEDIGIADMDRDSDLDIIFATEDHTIHELYFNTGNGVFRDMPNVLPNSIANSVLAVDVNNDSIPDLIFGNAGPSDTPAQNFILINNGDSTFTNQTASRLPAVLDITQDIKLGDIDGDGDGDMVVGNEDGNKLYINNGSGYFTDSTASRLPEYGSEETRKVTLYDIDGDNDLDIYFSNVAFRPGMNRQDRLLVNNGSGYFTDVTSTNIPPDAEHTTEAIFLDVDLDGDGDLITANIFYNRPVKVFLNNGLGVFTEATSEVLPPGVTGEGIGLKAADFNGDGLQDIYIVNRGQMDRLLLRNDTASTIGLQNLNGEVPLTFGITGVFPNPFNPQVTINISVPDGYAGVYALDIYTASGELTAAIHSSNLKTGNHIFNWSAGDAPSGVYYAVLKRFGETQSKNYISAAKLVLLK